MRILTLCGSLRARSSSRAILRAYARVAPPGVVVEHYEGTAALPHFNPDLDGEAAPAEVAALRARIAEAAAVVISTPEYAHALPGTFKNALDWLVSDPAFVAKPVVMLQAARGSAFASDSLREVLRTMSAKLLAAACVELPLGTNQVDADAILARDDLRARLVDSAERLVRELQGTPPPRPRASAPEG